VVEPFAVPAHWARFESMDHGAASPTAWHAWAADEDGNLVVIGEHYAAGKLVSEHAAAVLALRKTWHPANAYPAVYADPSTGAKIGIGNKLGDPASVQTEYAEQGIGLVGANNDRLAGYSRLLELLHVKPRRLPPTWADVPEDVGGAPRLYAKVDQPGAEWPVDDAIRRPTLGQCSGSLCVRSPSLRRLIGCAAGVPAGPVR
jgi:hypothetical protein